MSERLQTGNVTVTKRNAGEVSVIVVNTHSAKATAVPE
jgi:hypothetical protein